MIQTIDIYNNYNTLIATANDYFGNINAVRSTNYDPIYQPITTTTTQNVKGPDTNMSFPRPNPLATQPIMNPMAGQYRIDSPLYDSFAAAFKTPQTQPLPEIRLSDSPAKVCAPTSIPNPSFPSPNMMAGFAEKMAKSKLNTGIKKLRKAVISSFKSLGIEFDPKLLSSKTLLRAAGMLVLFFAVKAAYGALNGIGDDSPSKA